MTFKIDQYLTASAPLATGPAQRSQQRVVDLGVIDLRYLLQKLARFLGVEKHGYVLQSRYDVIFGRAHRVVLYQLPGIAPRWAAPVLRFLPDLFGLAVRSRRFGPLSDACGRAAEVYRLAIF